MMPLIVIAFVFLVGCAPQIFVQEGKSRFAARQDMANCAEPLWREGKITIDTSSEERRELITPCMEERGYQRIQ